MSIWFREYSLDELNKRGANTLVELLEIEFVAITDNSLEAMMPVTDKIKQPLGLVHGGANVVLAETLASTAANACVDLSKCFCVGLEINANHIRSVKDGVVKGITTPIHIGRTTHVWEIKLYDSEDNITCISRMTAQVVTRK